MKDVKKINTILKCLEGIAYLMEVHNTPRNNLLLETWTRKLNDVVFAEESQECDEPVNADTFDYDNVIF